MIIVVLKPLRLRYISLFMCNGRSHHYAQLGNALQKHFFAYSALIMGTLKGSIGRFFNFSAQSQNFTAGLTGPDFP